MSQTSLFPQPRRRPPPPERNVHIAVADTLRRALNPGWLWWHCANGEYRPERTGALLTRMGVIPGVADFILVGPPHGRIHALELKRRKCKPTEAQYRFLQGIVEAGGVADWADSYPQAVDILRAWGAVRARVGA